MKSFSTLLITLGLFLCAAQASAANSYLSRQAYELEAMSHKIANELRYAGEHRSLQREAAQLARQARRFREALDERYEHRRLQSRYSALSSNFTRFDRHYRQTRFGSHYSHLHRHYRSVNTLYFGLNSGFISYSNDFSGRHRYEPFVSSPKALSHRRGYRGYSKHRVEGQHKRNRYDDRGRRNHYK